MTGYIHSIESLGTLDGPGVRVVFFLQGCALRCRYCHNPDTWDIGAGREMSPRELTDIAVRYKEYYGQNGGVTFSGGEPLLQSEFLCECIELLKNEGIGVYIDTAGSVMTDAAKRALKSAYGVLLDIKHTDSAEYKKLCGGNLVDTKQTLEYIKNNKTNLIIRQVIVPGINDTECQVRELRRLAEDSKIELLAYHTLGVYKWEKLNLKYTLSALPPSDALMKKLKAIAGDNSR